MLRKLLLATGMVLSVSSLAYAAQQMGVAGRWSATVGTEAVVYNFTVSGDTLRGAMEIANYGLEAPVSGRVKGDSLFFSAAVPGSDAIAHQGKVVGDTLFFTLVSSSMGRLEGKAVRAR